ncbi:MAG: NAD(P)/FAD-dependent oxidoreductase [Anaerolineales bacterium]
MRKFSISREAKTQGTFHRQELLLNSIQNTSDRGIHNDARVAVMGGGPAGSFFSYFLLDMAERVGIELQVDIYEPRDFSLVAPQGCNMCAGVISESLVQNLAAEGIDLPTTVVQRAIDSYVMHTDVGSLRIGTPRDEKRIAALFRGAGPHGTKEFKWVGFDGYLLKSAENKGAQIINTRITNIERIDDQLLVKTRSDPGQVYDLLAVATGVNSAALKLFENREFNYLPPKTTKTAIQEYHLGSEAIEKYLGSSLHVFLLDIPRLDFAMIVPKGDFATVCLLGTDVDTDLLQSFLDAPEVKKCFPEDWDRNQPSCQCFPRINIQGAFRPFADRVVFLGDSGVSRLYKDGIGAAYRAAKAAAATVVFEGISEEDFRIHYWPACKSMHNDNRFGKVIFTVTRLIQRIRFSRRAVLRMADREQRRVGSHPHMSSVLWDTFTGSAPYKDIFLRTLDPSFLSHFIWDLGVALIDG